MVVEGVVMMVRLRKLGETRRRVYRSCLCRQGLSCKVDIGRVHPYGSGGRRCSCRLYLIHGRRRCRS